MTYRDKLELYKRNELSRTEQNAVSEDIEKHEAISDFLADSMELPELEGLSMADETVADTAEAEDSRQFEKQVASYIRKVFIKTGVIVGAAVLAIVLLVIFVLPKAVDSFYYDPGKIVGTSTYGGETNRMSMDLAVYSELFLPSGYRDCVSVEREGYGRYSIYVPQTYSYTGTFTDLAGSITRGKLQLYNPNILKRPTSNAFIPEICGVNNHYRGVGAAGSAEDAAAALQELNDSAIYRGYVTLDTVMGYEEFITWCGENDIHPEWCAICVEAQGDYEDFAYETGSVNAMGFCIGNSCSSLAFDEEKYPQLSVFSLSEAADGAFNWSVSAQTAEQHVVSLLRYTADHPEFSHMMDSDVEDSFYTYMADSIQEQGLHIYGFTVVADRSELLHIQEAAHAAYIYTTPVQ